MEENNLKISLALYIRLEFSHFKCIQLCKGILDFKLDCIKLLQNDFSIQQYITLNATYPG